MWIHKAVAEALNAKDAEEIRRGFHTGVFNSRGVHSVDPTGQPEKELADKFKNQAEAVEKEGFFRLATTMRHLSETYTKEAERIIADHHQDHQESNSPIGQLPDSIENSS